MTNSIEDKEMVIEETMEEMMAALEKMAKERKAKAQKRKVSNDLEEIIKVCTRDELKNILSSLNISFKASAKKDELVETLKVNYKEAIKEVLKKIDNNIYEDLQAIIITNGVLDKKIDKTFKENSYLERLGMLYLASDDQKNIYQVTPQEVIEAIKEIDKKDIEKNDEIVRLFRGMTHYYGFMSVDEFIENLPKDSGLDESHIRFLFLMLEDTNKNGLFVDNKWKSEFLEYAVDFQRMLEDEGLQNEPFKQFSLTELIEASNLYFIGDKSIYKPLSKILKSEYKIANDDINKMLEEIYMFSQVHSEEELKSFIIPKMNPPKYLEIQINDALHKVYNKIPLWKYKGYTVSEKLMTDVKNIKIGRNEKCPCGSGKKYKKCCGK